MTGEVTPVENGQTSGSTTSSSMMVASAECSELQPSMNDGLIENSLGPCIASSRSCKGKRRRVKSKKRRNESNNNALDHDLQEGNFLTNSAPLENRRCLHPADTNLNSDMRTMDCNAKRKKRTKRKQKRQHVSIENKDVDLHIQGACSVNNDGLESDSRPGTPVNICLKKGEEMRQYYSEIILSMEKNKRIEHKESHAILESDNIDYNREETGGISSLGVTNIHHIEKEDVSAVMEVTNSDKTGMKNFDAADITCSIPEKYCSSRNSADINSIKNNDNDILDIEIHQRKQINTYARKRKKSSNSLAIDLKPNMDSTCSSMQVVLTNSMRETPVKCSDELISSCFSENIIDQRLVVEPSTSIPIGEDVLMSEARGEVPDNSLANNPAPVKSKDRVDKNLKKVTIKQGIPVNYVLKCELLEDPFEQSVQGRIPIAVQDGFSVEEAVDGTMTNWKSSASKDPSGYDPTCECLKQKNGDRKMKLQEGVSVSHLGTTKDDNLVINRKDNPPLSLYSSPEKSVLVHSKKNLLILDINGLLADIVPYVPEGCKADKMISNKAVFKRPFCDDFLQFCFERFNVGVWSSRTKKNVDRVLDFLMGDSRRQLLFCWDQYHCTDTGYSTLDNRNKPLVLKELKKLWENHEQNLPWAKGEYNESNTLLLDDSPYKALRNPPYTAIFPHSYHCKDTEDMELGPGGALRVYLEGLAMADNVQKYVEKNPFGQRAITKSSSTWDFYRMVLGPYSYQRKYCTRSSGCL